MSANYSLKSKMQLHLLFPCVLYLLHNVLEFLPKDICIQDFLDFSASGHTSSYLLPLWFALCRQTLLILYGIF